MLSKELQLCLQDAYSQAREARHAHLTVEHLLLCILDTPKAREILRACGADADKLQQDLRRNIDATPRREDGGSVQPTLGFQRVMQRAEFHVQSARVFSLITRHLRSGAGKEVGVANVLVAIFSEKQSHAVLLLQDQHLSRANVVNYILHGAAPRA